MVLKKSQYFLERFLIRLCYSLEVALFVIIFENFEEYISECCYWQNRNEMKFEKVFFYFYVLYQIWTVNFLCKLASAIYPIELVEY